MVNPMNILTGYIILMYIISLSVLERSCISKIREVTFFSKENNIETLLIRYRYFLQTFNLFYLVTLCQ